MDSLAALGQTAGIGGIAIGALILVYRYVIERTTKRTSKQTLQLLNIVVILSFVVAISGIGAWAYGARQSDEAALAAAQSDCLGKLAAAQTDAPSQPAPLIDAGGNVVAGRTISIRADQLDRGAIRARCGDVRAEVIEAIIGDAARAAK